MAIADKQIWVYGKSKITENSVNNIWVYGKSSIVFDADASEVTVTGDIFFGVNF